MNWSRPCLRSVCVRRGVDFGRTTMHQGACCLCLALLASMLLAIGCEKQPLDEPLEKQFLSDSSLEVHFPPQGIVSMGDDLHDSMVDSGMNLLQLSPFQIKQQDGNGVFFILDTGNVKVVLTEVYPSVCSTGINFHLVFAPAEADLVMEASTTGYDPDLYQCGGKFLLPSRETFVHFSLEPDPKGDARLLLDGDPGLSGEPVTFDMGEGCRASQYMLDQARTILSDDLDTQLAGRLKPLLDELGKLATDSFGLKMGMSGKIGQNMLFELFADTLAPETSGTDGCNLFFSGGFDSDRGWCVPSHVTSILPTEVERTVFSDMVPVSEKQYSVAISVSLAFIRQGLLSAYRSGLLCTQASEFSLTSVDPVQLFMSTGELGRVQGMKVSTRPLGTPDVIWARPSVDSTGSLPGLYLVLPDVYMDVFISVDGLDLHAFEFRTDITVDLAPSLEDGVLSLDVFKVDVQKLEIAYNELTTERAGELRNAAIKLVEQVTRQLLEPLDGFALDLPSYCGKNLLGYELDDQHLIVYLGFTHQE